MTPDGAGLRRLADVMERYVRTPLGRADGVHNARPSALPGWTCGTAWAEPLVVTVREVQP